MICSAVMPPRSACLIESRVKTPTTKFGNLKKKHVLHKKGFVSSKSSNNLYINSVNSPKRATWRFESV